MKRLQQIGGSVKSKIGYLRTKFMRSENNLAICLKYLHNEK